jgi:retron-type reverse transcriptase
MKTYNNLFDKITAWDNLLLAAKNASKGKRFDNSVAKFNFRLESELFCLQRELQSKTYRPGAYTTFMIHDPKKRMISAARFRDRVVHHALCNVIEPIFEKTFIHDSYANRKGKGTHKAIERFQHYARRYRYVLKCDIKKFFPSLDHEILKQEIRWKIACPDTLWLIDLIIDNSNPQEEHAAYFPGDGTTPLPSGVGSGVGLRRRGLPIGNLTSQFWANVYLNRFDHFVKEELGTAGYVRYVDDFVLLSNDKTRLTEHKKAITERLADLRLLPHPNKTHIHKVEKGVPFLGFRVYPSWRIVRKESVRRYRRFCREKIGQWRVKRVSPQQIEDGLNSWLGHVRFGQSKRLEYNVFWQVRASGLNLLKHPNHSWRILERAFALV